MEAEQVDEVIGEGVQEQTKSVTQEAATTEPVGMQAVLELFDAVLALPALVIEAENLGTATGTVGHQEAKIGAGGRVLGFGFVSSDGCSERECWVCKTQCSSTF